MKSVSSSLAAGVVAASFLVSSAAAAETCEERFVAIYLKKPTETPQVLHITTTMSNGMEMENEFYWKAFDHHMTKPITPAGPWVLTYGATMYQSGDEGQTWSKVRDLDVQPRHEDMLEGLKQNVATLANATCGTAELDGVPVDTVAGDVTNHQMGNAPESRTYWLRRDGGGIAMVEITSRMQGMETTFTQRMTDMPEMTLPLPE